MGEQSQAPDGAGNNIAQNRDTANYANVWKMRSMNFLVCVCVCSAYNKLREELYAFIYNLYPSFMHLSTRDKLIIYVLTFMNTVPVNSFAKFVHFKLYTVSSLCIGYTTYMRSKIKS